MKPDTKKGKVGKRGTNPPSHASLLKNTEARIQELKAAGRNRAEVVVILASEGYKRNEISGALKLDPRELDNIISGSVRPEDAAVQPDHRDTAPIRQLVTDDPLSNYSEQVQFVGRSLTGVSGISAEAKKTLLDKLEAGKDFYFGPAANPGMLANALTNASIPWYKVHNILTEYGMRMQMQMGPQGQAMMGGYQGGWSSFGQQQPTQPQRKTAREELRERLAEMQLDQLDQIAIDRLTGGKSGGNDDRMDRIMDRAEEYKVMSTIFRDETGLKGGLQIEEMTEYEKSVNEKDGTEQYVPVRTVRRPVVPSPGAQQGGDELDKVLSQLAKGALIKNLLQGMNGGGTVPGIETISEPMLNEENEPILDKSGQPIMRTRTIPASGGSKGTSDLAVLLQLADKQQDTALKVAELMKPKGGGDGDAIMTMMLKRIDQLGDSQMKMLQDQVNAMQNSDPLGYMSDIMDKLRKIGAFGGDKAQSLEIAKMENDFNRWKWEKDDEFKRWSSQQRQSLEDKKYARKQLDEFGRTIRDGIKEVGAPIAKGFADGYAETKKGMRNSGSAVRAPPERGEEKDVGKMSNAELQAMLGKVDTAGKTVEKARENVVAELTARGIKI